MLPATIGMFVLHLIATSITSSSSTTTTHSSAPSTIRLKPMSEIRHPVKAILFDMDGTLLDTEALSDKAILLAFGASLPKSVLEKSPMNTYRIPWELKKQILGLRGTEWAPIVLEYAKNHWGVGKEKNDDINSSNHIYSQSPPPPPSPEQFCKLWEEHLNSMCEEIDACDGAEKLVQEFANIGIPMAIATSSRYAGVMKKRKRHESIFGHMKAIVAGDDPAVKNGKPAPDIYEEAARRLNVHPQDCLVFEDALSGVRAGKAAGCQVVAIPDSRFSEQEKACFFQEATVLVDTLKSFDGTEFGLNVGMSSSSSDIFVNEPGLSMTR